ncbi:MFS transporter [Rhodococcus sp. 05-2256-B2]|uniref:YbfB/YjiJ family MFS transporter n=1 Tax=unclassified Rhodococcus (in: high G+C Gram-positive bacteria) TaxID=192944 RepID=UPI000B9BAE5E|nr:MULTISPECIES: YbfB/YjiJ family MFS transporter [unclassified Rhodococcus (in: high G+C Gram-positive bacteria)]OZD86987.1 MFS transporter [Rhodococcus sp. 05-2256-B4]OZD90000.1 MFS transporter [Rhodococcus sp. 05-2256-B2]OZD92318.1 MFS transporter [Rhodococcus sp. 05-2256-B3]OZD99023.1 MFS transporter [Rhodococcus sp. 05-2256-B1]
MNGRRLSFAAAAGLAAAMGVGRFVFTPLLPIMVDAAEVTPSSGAVIATANYAGYLVGAIVLSVRPSINTTTSFRLWTLVLIASEMAMAAVHSTATFSALRFLAGLASAAVFIACASTVTKHRADGASPGIAFGGVGAGIAASGILTLLAGPHLSWEALWLCSAILTAVLVAPAWTLRVHPEPAGRSEAGEVNAGTRAVWRTLLVAYFLEGLGYIVVGTFLVAAVGGHGSTSVGPAVWIGVGLAAVPATVLWQGVARRTSLREALVAAFALQTVAAVLPALTGNTLAAVCSALLFGGTFMGITMLTMSTAQSLPIGRTAATLTTVYGVGQVVGPLVVAPAIGDSYAIAFAIATGVLVLGTAGAVRVSQLTAPR